MFSINMAQRFSAANKPQKGRFPSIIAFGIICFICGEQLGKKENLENQQRPQFSRASGHGFVNPHRNQTATEEPLVLVQVKLKND